MTAPSREKSAVGGSPRPVVEVVALVAIPVAVVLGLVAGAVTQSVIVGVILLVVVGVVVAYALRRTAGGRADAAIGGRPADPIRQARLANLTDGLAVGAGVKAPALRVVDAPGLNLAVIGDHPGAATLVVTSALLEELTRMELEAVVALGVVAIRRRDFVAATVAAGTFGIGAKRTVPPDRDRTLDEAAVTLTRYPPGLVSAYAKMAALGTGVPGTPPSAAHLWFVDPAPAGGAGVPYRVPLRGRIQSLEEL